MIVPGAPLAVAEWPKPVDEVRVLETTCPCGCRVSLEVRVDPLSIEIRTGTAQPRGLSGSNPHRRATT